MADLSKVKLLITLCAALIFPYANADLYNLEDLTILAKEKSFREFFNHALDVKPTQRSALWKEMLEKLSLEFIEDLLSRKTKVPEADLKIIHKISIWPILKNNEFFSKKRDLLFLKHLSLCFTEKKKNCLESSHKLYDGYEHSPIVSFDFITLLGKNNIDDFSLWHFSKELVKNKISEFYCHKSPLKEVILNQIYADISKNQTLTINIHKDCFKSLTQELRSHLSSKKPYQRRGAFTALTYSKTLTSTDHSLFYLLEFLTTEKLDHKELDLALLNFKEIGKNLPLRENLLAQLKLLDPLPDNIFVASSSHTNITKLRVLFRHFPEYVDYYAATCLTYLKGEREFPQGNPTPECHGLFRLDEQLKILPGSFKSEYKKATFFLTPQKKSL